MRFNSFQVQILNVVQIGKVCHSYIAEVFDKKKVVENTIEKLF